ncbi:MAG: ABC transporter permease [Bacteroidota bacterium]
MRNTPPRLAQRFFSWYCRNHLHDSILGDLEEQFYQNQRLHGTRRARWRYWLGVLQFMNRFTLKRNRDITSYDHYHSTGMIKNYLISSFRFFRRNKAFVLINTLGLTLGFSSFLLSLIFVNHELSFDQFHQNKEDVYRVNFSYQDNAGNVTTLVNSPPALARGIEGKFPELARISRMRYAMNCLLANGETGFYEDHGYYADSLFLEILQFELSSGDPQTALDEPNTIVITEAMAMKYFNEPDPIGATLLFNNTTPLKITGVLSNIPTTSHLNFDFLISFSTYTVPEGYASDLTSWSWLGFLTYVELKPMTDPSQFEQKLVQQFKEIYPDNPNPPLPMLQNLSDIYLGSVGMADDLASHIRSGNRFSVNALLTVGILIIVIAAFNFSNLTNALSINRAKSTGIRKTLGANKNGIMKQLLAESLLLSFFCLSFALELVFLSFPTIALLMGWEFYLGAKQIWSIVPIAAGLAFLVGLCSGFYPALTIARFDVIQSLKGVLKVGSRSPFQVKHVLVLLQFAVSIGLISATLIMTQQVDYLRSKTTGYDAENVVLIKALPEDMARYFDPFKEQLVSQSSVINVSRSERVVGDPWPWSIIQRVDQSDEMSKRVFFNLADYDYFETMGISLHSGRSFSKEHVKDTTQSIIINRKAAEYLELDDPVGTQVHFFELDGPRTIVGVVEDFNYASLHEEIEPAVMILPFINLEYAYVRFQPGDLISHVTLLENTWKEVAQGTPLEWKFLDDNLNRLYHTEEKLSLMIKVFATIAIALACLGLYGIVMFIINNRIKEFGIRKVLGASVRSLYTLFVSRYVYQILLALVMIVPLIHYLLNAWLEGFAYRIEINWIIYPMAAIAMLVMILLTITFQTLKAARTNPTGLLRDE